MPLWQRKGGTTPLMPLSPCCDTVLQLWECFTPGLCWHPQREGRLVSDQQGQEFQFPLDSDDTLYLGEERYFVPASHVASTDTRVGKAVLSTAGRSSESMIPIHLPLTLTQQGENWASHDSQVRVWAQTSRTVPLDLQRGGGVPSGRWWHVQLLVT